MIEWLGRRDPEEVLLAAVFVLWLGGGVVLVLRSRLAGVALLLASIAVWACFWLVMLRNDAVGHDCSEPHHEGELPALLLTLVWGALVAIVLRRPRSLAVRLGVVAGTAGVFAGSITYVLAAQPAC